MLHLAASHGWVDIVIDLVTKYKCDTNCKDTRGCTPLHYAARKNHLEVVRYFINEQHCDPMTRDNDMVIHHFTMLVAMVTSTLCNIFYPLVK